MDYQLINDKILEVYIECQIRNFPIDCIEILQHYHFRLLKYSEIKQANPELHEIAKKFSDDAFKYGNIICYNSSTVEGRVRFSLMHELGHYLLGHTRISDENENEADYFASCILAPRIILWKNGCKSADDIHSKFGLSYSASNRALNDMQRWKFRPKCESETALYELLYPSSVLKKSKPILKEKAPDRQFQKKWAKLEERNKFIEIHYGSLTNYAFAEYEYKLSNGIPIF